MRDLFFNGRLKELKSFIHRSCPAFQSLTVVSFPFTGFSFIPIVSPLYCVDSFPPRSRSTRSSAHRRKISNCTSIKIGETSIKPGTCPAAPLVHSSRRCLYFAIAEKHKDIAEFYFTPSFPYFFRHRELNRQKFTLIRTRTRGR